MKELERLKQTGKTLDAAAQECPHWDYEATEGEHYLCCEAMRQAVREHRTALRAAAAACDKDTLNR